MGYQILVCQKGGADRSPTHAKPGPGNRPRFTGIVSAKPPPNPYKLMQTYHLVPSGQKWTLTREGGGAPVGLFDNKTEAMQSSTEFLRDREGSLKIHTADGAIEEERTYPRSADPVRSRG